TEKLDPFKDLVAERIFVTSKDGTKLPMFVLHQKGIPLNGNNPTILSAYGGFGIGSPPHSHRELAPFFRRGGVFAWADLRGGDEYGEAWHDGGRLGNKQNSFDDFVASAEALIAAGYTRPEKLGIMGQSNGGLLVSAAITERPDLFRAAKISVPLTDMLRYDTS